MIIDIIKTWDFCSQERSTMTFHNSARLNTQHATNPRLQLSGTPFPTNDDNYVVTKSTFPHRVMKWKMFEPIWSTTEPYFKEFSILLSNKNGSTFDYVSHVHQLEVGDHVYQSDYRTTVASVGSDVTLSDGSQFQDGRALVVRSKCEVLYRIYDADDNQWFYNTNTSTWEQPVTNDDWSTPYVINNHFPDLDLKTFNQTLGFLVNLRTSDPTHTPLVMSLQVLGQYDLEFAEDMIFDSIIPQLEEKLTCTTQVVMRLNSDTDTINLSTDYQISDGYNITDVEVVYNRSDDPNRVNDISSSYILGTPKRGGGHNPGVVVLNSVQTSGSILELKLRFFPEIAVNTSREYYEVAKVPLMVFEHIEKKTRVVSSKSELGRNYIRNKLTLEGVLEDAPEQYDLIVEYAVFTDNQTDQYRIGEAIHRLFNTLNMVSSWGLDVPYPVVSDDIYRSQNSPNVADVNTHVGRFRIVNFVEFISEPKNVYLVDYLQNTMTTN